MSDHHKISVDLTTPATTGGRDWFLIGLLLVIFCIGLNGIHWGRVECWNTDQMALRAPFTKGAASYTPGWFHKPPFHTYTNFFLVRVPIILLQKALQFSDPTQLAIELIASRLLTLSMYLGSLLLYYRMLRESFGRFTARALTAVFGTGAGLFVDTHFLTADIPVLFWMMFSFYFANRILHQQSLRYYLFAGLLAGLATATKYNGLAIGLAIPLAHLLATGYSSASEWRKALMDPKVYAGMLAIPLGFLLGNPYAVLDHKKFIADFVFNYQAAYVYDGHVEGHSYLAYFDRFGELIGLPGLAFITISAVASLVVLWRRQGDRLAVRAVVLAFGVFLIYYLQFGSMPRLPARFTMPSLPFFIVLGAPVLVVASQRLIAALLTPIIAYNLVCAVYVGQRFVDDGRMLAQDWVVENVTGGRTIESHIFVPEWKRMTGADLKEVRTPYVSGRHRMFEQLLPAGSNARSQLDKQEPDGGLAWFTREALLKRRPDFVAIDRSYYGVFFEPPVETLYPEMRHYFDSLLSERMPYREVFHAETLKYPAWIYPQDIEFLRFSLTIFQRDDERFAKEVPKDAGTATAQ